MIRSEIKRYFTVSWLLVKASLMTLFSYRSDYLMHALGGIGYGLMLLVFTEGMFTKFDTIAGWTKWHIVLLVAFGQLSYHLGFGLFGSVYNINQEIIRGSLDRHLLKPLSLAYLLLMQNVNPIKSAPIYMFYILLLLKSLSNLNLPITFYTSSLSLVFICVGAAFVVLFVFLLQILGFFYDDTADLVRIAGNVFDNNQMPMDIFSQKVKTGALLLVPIAFAGYVPAKLLIFGFNLKLVVAYLGVFSLYLLITKILLSKGLNRYASANS